MRYLRLLPLALALICGSAGVLAHDEPSTDSDKVTADIVRKAVIADDFNRGTPKRSDEGFKAAADAGDYERAAEYLDLRNLKGDAHQFTGIQLARHLNVVMKRATWVDVDELVDDPAGRSKDGLPAYRDSVGIVLDNNREVQLFMQRVPRGDGVAIWKISNATVSMIPELYATYGYPKIIEELRRSLPATTILGIELFKLVTTLGTSLFVYLSIFLSAFTIRYIYRHSDAHLIQRLFKFLILPIGIWATVITFNATTSALGRSTATEAWQQITPVPELLTIWVMFVGVNLIRSTYSDHLQRQNRRGATVFLNPVSTAIKTLLAIVIGLIYLNKLGIHIGAVLAGLGVGGVAVALALQKPLEDLFGALTLYTQQPVRVGDFCRIGDYTGTVEEISLRTTRVRTLANTVIAIPNGRLANEPIDNISARSKILYRPSLRLKYDSTPDQLQQVLEGIRHLLSTHDQVEQDNCRVRFNDIADDALLIEVFAYLNTTDWAKYLELAESLNIDILKIVAAAGTHLSVPARTIRIEPHES